MRRWRSFCFGERVVAKPQTPQPHFPLVQSLCLGAGASVFACYLGHAGILPPPLPESLAWGPWRQLGALLPFACALAWVALSVASPLWRGLIQGVALAQLAGASALALLCAGYFHCGVPAVAFLTVWVFGEAARLLFPFASLATPVSDAASKEQQDAAVPQRTQCTVLHCEILNHSQLVSLLPPADAVHFINRFLAICEETASARYGKTDRADSEAFRAVFEPHPEGEPHSKAALHAALAIQARLANLSTECEVRFGQELDARLGVSSGELLLARFGPTSAQRNGAAGEAAEWARRLAGANLLYGSRILMSEYTAALAGRSVETRPIDLLQRELPPQGPEEVFELLALAGTLDSESSTRLTHYRRGVAHLRNRNWKAARNALRAARPIGRTDDAIDILLHRIDEQEALASYAQAQNLSSPTE